MTGITRRAATRTDTRTLTAFAAGDRVICEGGGCWNSHRSAMTDWESECVTKIPDGVAYEDAVMGKLASVAMYGVRILEHAFGDTVAIFGLGVRVTGFSAYFSSLSDAFRNLVYEHVVSME